MFQQT